MSKSDQMEVLALRYKNAFALLYIIAKRAKREDCLDLKAGQALVGDYANHRLTKSQYRTALKTLQRFHIIDIQPTNKGTIVTLCDSGYYDLNILDDIQDMTLKSKDNQKTIYPNKNKEVINNKNIFFVSKN